jgi:nucleoid-associated protein YgaU
MNPLILLGGALGAFFLFGRSTNGAKQPSQSPLYGGPAYDSYTVVSGDSLSKIAGRLYGDVKAWPRIFDANRDIVSDPNLIYPGQVLRIPR